MASSLGRCVRARRDLQTEAGAHTATRERSLEATTRELLVQGGAFFSMGFDDDLELPSELALLHILPCLPRTSGGLLAVSTVCTWSGMALSLHSARWCRHAPRTWR